MSDEILTKEAVAAIREWPDLYAGQSSVAMKPEDVSSLADSHEAMRERVRALEGALRFYADTETRKVESTQTVGGIEWSGWHKSFYEDRIKADGGNLARAALGKEGG